MFLPAGPVAVCTSAQLHGWRRRVQWAAMRAVANTLVAHPCIPCTPHALSEIHNNEPYNEKVDVFSFAVVLYELLARVVISFTEIPNHKSGSEAADECVGHWQAACVHVAASGQGCGMCEGVWWAAHLHARPAPSAGMFVSAARCACAGLLVDSTPPGAMRDSRRVQPPPPPLPNWHVPLVV